MPVYSVTKNIHLMEALILPCIGAKEFAVPAMCQQDKALLKRTFELLEGLYSAMRETNSDARRLRVLIKVCAYMRHQKCEAVVIETLQLCSAILERCQCQVNADYSKSLLHLVSLLLDFN